MPLIHLLGFLCYLLFKMFILAGGIAIQALAVLDEKFGPRRGLAMDGFVHEKITGIGYSAKTIDSGGIPFLVSQLKDFPYLRKVVFFGKKRLSEADLALLKAEFPKVVFAREWQ